MGVRVRFSAEDLARLRVAPPDPFAETLFTVIPLRDRAAPAPFTPWRHHVLQRMPPPARPVLATWHGFGPTLDLLSVTGPTGDLDAALDRLAGAPRRVVDTEVECFARVTGAVPAALAPLLHHDRRARTALVTALRAHHDAAVAPVWSAVRGVLARHHRRATARAAESGADALLEPLRRWGVHWRAPVLEVRSSVSGDPTTEIDLGGRGLVLLPSLFFGPRAVLFHDVTRSGPDTLVHPVLDLTGPDGTAPDLRPGDPSRDAALAALLGPTRARVLAAVPVRGCSTTALAALAGVAPASASEHAAVLRDAGLLATVRSGRSVRHRLTDLGERLLRP